MVSYNRSVLIYNIIIPEVFILKLLDKIKNTVLTGCLYYTIVSLLMYALSLIIVQQQMVPTLKTLCSVLAASIFTAAVNNIFYAKNLSSFFKLLIHFIASVAAFYVIFILIGGLSNNGATMIIAFVLFIFIYAVIVSVSFFIRKSASEKQIRNSKYENQFDDVSMKK